ncbi:MAG: response regulator transcription factor [Parabacteroides sp.]
MRRNKKIALILRDTLQSCGLQSLLVDYFQPVEISPFPTLDALQANGLESFDYYFTDAEQFTEGADYFLPRRSKTIIIVNHGIAAHSSNALQCLATDLAPEQLIEQLQQIFEAVPQQELEGNKELSSREIDVLQLVAKGITNKEIADRLNISLNTVLTHRKNITTKLGIKTVSGLTFYAIMNGFLSGDEF